MHETICPADGLRMTSLFIISALAPAPNLRKWCVTLIMPERVRDHPRAGGEEPSAMHNYGALLCRRPPLTIRTR